MLNLEVREVPSTCQCWNPTLCPSSAPVNMPCVYMEWLECTGVTVVDTYVVGDGADVQGYMLHTRLLMQPALPVSTPSIYLACTM